ncbi:hypothetical protein EV175_000014 [Coemansia sp. RSA 1933]|nr:hypothetical protein EV175_000014 [Coemansia sp. RSA 1933]
MYKDLYLHLKSDSEQVDQYIIPEGNRHMEVDEMTAKRHTRHVHIKIDTSSLFSSNGVQGLVDMAIRDHISKKNTRITIAIARGEEVRTELTKGLESTIVGRFARFVATFGRENKQLELNVTGLSGMELSEAQHNILSTSVDLLLGHRFPLDALIADSYYLKKFGTSSFRDLRKLDLTLTDSGDSSSEFELIHSNASTLQWLRVSMEVSAGFERLVRGAEEQPIAYPRLEELTVVVTQQETQQSAERLMVGREHTPFPQLRQVDLGETAYPFGDDTLFRGNQATLAAVKMPMDRVLAAVLTANRDGAPVLGSHTALYKFEISGNIDETVADDDDAWGLQQAISANMLPQVTSLGITDIDLSGIFLDVVSTHARFTRIQVLRLKMYPISVQEALPLFGILRMLRVFESGVSEVGSTLSHMPTEMLAKYVRSIGPEHLYLREWQIYQAGSVNQELLLMSSMLLALACPNARIVEVGGTSDDEYLLLDD